ncbi:MAG: endolytic transglycosylase MltG [Alphaproteobacteria bacterium]|nr:endolytic transglycosylase MltG [Alphaproteobacteria bacterium]
MSAFFKIVGLLILLGVAVGVGAYFYGRQSYASEGPTTASGSMRTVIVEPGSSVRTIADKLTAVGAIEDDLPFRIAVRLTRTAPRLKAGEYAIDSGASLKDIIDQMVAGRVVFHAVTAPEGLTSAMILRRLAEEPILTGELSEVTPAEGVLLPDTYMVQRGESRQSVVARMIASQQALIAELWPNRQPGLPFDTAEEAVILASVVEKETGIASERPLVAAVFVNRLRRGMALESDPTIIYGLTRGEPLGHGLRRSEIDRKNAWNTYQISGLPPTPICNPGRDAIAAVLNPPVTDALFFVADGSGGHAFSSSYAEHLGNVSNLREIEARNAALDPAAAVSN